MYDAPLEGATRPPTEHPQGIVERVTYHAEDSGYTVARLKVPSHADLVTIVGSFPAISAGQTLRVTGWWREHPKFGPQFQVLQAQETIPATLTGVEKYLGSGLIKGIGLVTAKRIVAHFGLETLDIIEAQGERHTFPSPLGGEIFGKGNIYSRCILEMSQEGYAFLVHEESRSSLSLIASSALLFLQKNNDDEDIFIGLFGERGDLRFMQ